MAFDRFSTNCSNLVRQDILWKHHIEHEDDSFKLWQEKWSWILDEYNALHENLMKISQKSKYLADVRGPEVKKDPRSIAPIPESVNHQYGWISTRPEFQLQRYGPDVYSAGPLPDLYKIFKEQ